MVLGWGLERGMGMRVVMGCWDGAWNGVLGWGLESWGIGMRVETARDGGRTGCYGVWGGLVGMGLEWGAVVGVGTGCGITKSCC